MNNILGKKIELLPHQPKTDEIICPICGGIGWLEDGYGHIVKCTNPQCDWGIIKCCPECGKPYKKRYYFHCDSKECLEKEYLKRLQDEVEEEKLRFNKAQKINYDDAPTEIKEMVYSNKGDGEYYDDLEWIDDLENEEKPTYVWATYKETIHIDAINIVENACDELHEDAFENINDIDELQNSLDNWCAKQTGADTYYVDYKIALII